MLCEQFPRKRGQRRGERLAAISEQRFGELLIHQEDLPFRHQGVPLRLMFPVAEVYLFPLTHKPECGRKKNGTLEEATF